MFVFHDFGWESDVMCVNISTSPKDRRCGGSLERGYLSIQSQQLLSHLNAVATPAPSEINCDLVLVIGRPCY